jgi:hypothetical protein
MYCFGENESTRCALALGCCTCSRCARLVLSPFGTVRQAILSNMLKRSIVILLAVVASTNALWLYSATSFNLEYTLYAINTDTYTVYKVGTVQDAAGDKFTVGGMHYDATTQLLYAIGNSRASNDLKDNGLLAINPLTAQGMFCELILCWKSKNRFRLGFWAPSCVLRLCGRKFVRCTPRVLPKIFQHFRVAYCA